MTQSMMRSEHCGTRQEHHTLLLNEPGISWLFARMLLQHHSLSQQAVSRVEKHDVSEVARGGSDSFKCPVQCYSEVFRLRAKGHGFIVIVDIQ